MDRRIVVVTGASSGVGRAIARAFGKRGARVALLARNEEALAHAAREIEASAAAKAWCAPSTWLTLQAVWGQKLLPGLLDRYLARTAYESQMTSLPSRRKGCDILFDTLPGDPGAHGPYRDQERGPDLPMRLSALTQKLLNIVMP